MAPSSQRREPPQNPGRFNLVKAALRDPFKGIGNPEPLKYLGSNVWSRRITQEHRCVYLVKADRIDFLQGRYHY
jgi:toxin YoeB